MAIDEILFEAEDKMESGIDYLQKEFRGIRTGRAATGMVEFIKVDCYGSSTDLRQLASISAPEASLIVVKPFDPGTLKEIERAIQASDLGITPSHDDKIIRLVVPGLSMERRHLLGSQLKKMAEATRVTIRNARRDANKDADKQQKASELTEDEAKKCKDDIQKLTDKYEKKVSEMLDAKTKEIKEG